MKKKTATLMCLIPTCKLPLQLSDQSVISAMSQSVCLLSALRFLSLLPGGDLLEIELELRAFENVAIRLSDLPRLAGDGGQYLARAELLLQFLGQNALLPAFGDLLLTVLTHFFVVFEFLRLSRAEVDVIVIAVPQFEGRRVDAHNGALRQRLRAHVLVVRGMVHHVGDARLLRALLRPPREIAVVQTQSAELKLSTAHTHQTNFPLSTEFGVRGGTGALIRSLLLRLFAATTCALASEAPCFGDTHRGCTRSLGLF